MTEKDVDRIIFSGDKKQVDEIKNSSRNWLTGFVILMISVILFFEWDCGFIDDIKLMPGILMLFGIVFTITLFCSFWLIPQNFEIRVDGIAPGKRRFEDIRKRREYFIKFSEMSDITIGDLAGKDVLNYRITLKSGTMIKVDIGNSIFAAYSLPESKCKKAETIMRSIMPLILKGESLITKEQAIF